MKHSEFKLIKKEKGFIFGSTIKFVVFFINNFSSNFVVNFTLTKIKVLFIYRYTCNKGFYPKGENTVVCLSNQTYNFTYFYCKPNMCQDPLKLKYGSYKLKENLHVNLNYVFNFTNN